MPIYLPPISRRRFLGGMLAAGTGAFCPGWVCGEETKQTSQSMRLLLMSDTHIPSEPQMENHSVRPAEHLSLAVKRILTFKERFDHAIVTGDCAFEQGKAGDYRLLGELLHPIRKTMGCWLTVGNHDHRSTFLEAFPGAREMADPSARSFEKFVYVHETHLADLIFLDSLHVTHDPTGMLGKPQLEWLAKRLDSHPNKPAILFAHHSPSLRSGHSLHDTQEFYDVIVPRKQVKAYVFGHTHAWRVSQHEGIQLINIPTVSAWKDGHQPRGFLVAELTKEGIAVTLHASDHKHPKHLERQELSWRPGVA